MKLLLTTALALTATTFAQGPSNPDPADPAPCTRSGDNCDNDRSTWSAKHLECRGYVSRNTCPETDGCMWVARVKGQQKKCSERECTKIGEAANCRRFGDCLWHRGLCYVADGFVPPQKCGTRFARDGCRGVPGCDWGLIGGTKKCHDQDGVGCRNMWDRNECESYSSRTGGRDECIWIQAQGTRGGLSNPLSKPAHCRPVSEFEPICSQQGRSRCEDDSLTHGACMWVHGHGCTDFDPSCDGRFVKNNRHECEERPNCFMQRVAPEKYRCTALNIGEAANCRALNRRPNDCRAEVGCYWDKFPRKCKAEPGNRAIWWGYDN